MEFALGVLGQSPDTFWAMTVPEFWTAFDGWRKANVPSKPENEPLNQDELNALEAMKRRFGGPHGPSAGRALKPEEVEGVMARLMGPKG